MKNKINPWIEMSIEYASQRSYLDDLFQVYPTIPDGIREFNSELWRTIEKAFGEKDNTALLKNLVKLDKIFARYSEPKETNRQIGPLFKRWLNNKSLGIQPVKLKQFLATKENAVLDASDAQLMTFVREHLNYKHNKGLDFVGRFNGKYVIGEARFLTDFGGHQNAQFNDATNHKGTKNVKAEKIIILDGYLCSLDYSKMYERFSEVYKDYNVMSILILRTYLYQL